MSFILFSIYSIFLYNVVIVLFKCSFVHVTMVNFHFYREFIKSSLHVNLVMNDVLVFLSLIKLLVITNLVLIKNLIVFYPSNHHIKIPTGKKYDEYIKLCFSIEFFLPIWSKMTKVV